MAITVLAAGRSRGAPGASGSTVIDWASDEGWTLLENDVIVVTLGNVIADNVSISTAGYNELTGGGISNGTHWLKVYWKRMGPSPDPTCTIAYSGATSYTETHYHIRGVDTTTALDAAIQTDTGASGAVNPPALVTVTTGALRIVGGSIDDDRVDTTFTAPAGYSNETARQSANTGANAHTTMTATKLAGAAGSEDPAAFGSAGDDTWISFHLALRPLVRKLAADAGSYGVSGTSATLRIGRKLAADAGSYAVTGTSATLLDKRKAAAATGSYAATGTAASLEAARKAAAAAGGYTTTGATATLRRAWETAAAEGSYAHIGTDATPMRAGKTAADVGSYAHSGVDAAPAITGRALAAEAGSYAVAGTAATLAYVPVGAYLVSAEAGSYAITGTAATLTSSAVPPEPEPEPAVVTVPGGGGPGGGRRAARLRKKHRDEMYYTGHLLLGEWDARPLGPEALEYKRRFEEIVARQNPTEAAPVAAPVLPKFDPAPFLEANERAQARIAEAEAQQAEAQAVLAAIDAEEQRLADLDTEFIMWLVEHDG